MSHQQHESPEHQQSQQMMDSMSGMASKANNSKVAQKGKKVAKEAGKKAGKKLLKMGAKALKKVGVALAKALAKSLVLLAKPLLIIAVVLLVICLIWYIVYEIRGSDENYAFDSDTKQTQFNEETGYWDKSDEATGQTKAIKEFYNYFGGKRSHWQIKGNDNKKLIPGDHEDAVEDYYHKESQFSINPNFLFVLDEQVFKREFRYPEQFVEPVNYDPDKLTLKHLTDSKGFLTAKSTKYDDEGFETDEKVKGVWDYGFGTIFKYKKDKITRTVEGKYNKMDVWDDEKKKVVQVSINEPFVEVMDGYPESIDLMTHAITFTGDYTFEYEDKKSKLSGAEGELKSGDKGSKKNEAVNKIYYKTFDYYEDVPIYEDVPYTVTEEYTVWVTKTREVPVYGVIWFPYPHWGITGYEEEEYQVQETREKDVVEYRREKVGTKKVFRGSYDLYKYRTGAVYETKPVEKPKQEEAMTEEEKKKFEAERLRYLQDYLFYFKSYVPESVMDGFDFNERVGQLIQTNMELGGSANFSNGNFAGAMQHWDIVQEYASKYGIEPEAIVAKIAQESGGRANIEDGVMQITGDGKRCVQPSNGAEVCVYNEADRRNPEKAIAWGVAYFSTKLEKYNGDYLKAIQSHNLDPQWIFTTYPETAESLDWLNYREEMRLHYGQKEGYGLTKSASYDCMPGFDASGYSGRTTYGDVCYLEHVLRYYKGTMLAGVDAVDTPSEDEQKSKKVVDAIKSFFGIAPNNYLEDEERFDYERSFSEKQVDHLLTVVRTFDKKISYREAEDETSSLFWEKGSGSGSGNAMTKEQFQELVGDTQYATPFDFDASSLKTSDYNAVESVRNGRQHKGVDIGVPVGTPLYAVANGTIAVAVSNQTHSKESWGNYVKIKLDDGNYVLYGHMNYVDVKVGDRVEMGDYIGDSGNSGNSTGPHLHFEFYYQSPETSARRDPTHIVIQPELFK